MKRELRNIDHYQDQIYELKRRYEWMKENTDEEMPSDEAIEAEQELMREKLNRRKAEIL